MTDGELIIIVRGGMVVASRTEAGAGVVTVVGIVISIGVVVGVRAAAVVGVSISSIVGVIPSCSLQGDLSSGF